MYKIKIVSDGLVFIKHYGILKGGETLFAVSELAKERATALKSSPHIRRKIIIDVRQIDCAELTNMHMAFHAVMKKKLSVFLPYVPHIRFCYLVNPDNPSTPNVLLRVESLKQVYGEELCGPVARSVNEAIELWDLPHDFFAAIEDV